MTSAISSITGISLPDLAPAGGKGGEFQSVLNTAIQAVETTHTEAQTAVNQFLTGESEDLHKVALAGQRAELSSELFLQVRNKVISAYQEIMRMQM
jgi:flagellar hook-basal body complex protein FliE